MNIIKLKSFTGKRRERKSKELLAIKVTYKNCKIKKTKNLKN